MIPRILLPILLAFALCASPAARAGQPKPRPPRVHHHTVIETVSADSITISESGNDKTYKITKGTEITFKGETTTADKLEAGMRVSITPDGADETAASVIQANDPPKDPTPKKGK